MVDYYVNKQAQSSGDHEVHTSFCPYLPEPNNRQYLGSFYNCKDAIAEAKKYYTNVDGCFYCSKECHTR